MKNHNWNNSAFQPGSLPCNRSRHAIQSFFMASGHPVVTARRTRQAHSNKRLLLLGETQWRR